MSDQWVTAKITGLDKLQAAFEQLDSKVRKKGLRRALYAGGAVILSAMQALAPKKSGFLASHFGMKQKVDSQEVAGSCFIGPQGKMDYPALNGAAGPLKRGQKPQRVAVATVARFLEFGTNRMGRKPFMTQAFESFKQMALGAIIYELKSWIFG